MAYTYLSPSDSAELGEYLRVHFDDFIPNVMTFNELMCRYEAAIKEITTKLEILKSDFSIRHHRPAIESVQHRLKSPASILQKLCRRGLPPTMDAMRTQLNDIAGVRVVCSFVDDIYMVAQSLARQDDVRVIAIKDYIETPKPNGYRSYHMVIEVPVFFSDTTENMRVEVQLRTVAMDFWATLEHQMKYKKDVTAGPEILEELRQCADVIADTDRRMLSIRQKIEENS